jgi:hypothetical protein
MEHEWWGRVKTLRLHLHTRRQTQSQTCTYVICFLSQVFGWCHRCRESIEDFKWGDDLRKYKNQGMYVVRAHTYDSFALNNVSFPIPEAAEGVIITGKRSTHGLAQPGTPVWSMPFIRNASTNLKATDCPRHRVLILSLHRNSKI